MTTVDELQNAARRRLLDAARQMADAENELRDAVKDGIAARLSKTEVAQLASVSRTTIYDWTRSK